ncbi:MAG TPA: amidophosphoribosyltransferase [Candidatus Omnitrophota bacterium]|nr:amidophosphoribosyltransferase [Candidatus Omnitrophota bacterium]
MSGIYGVVSKKDCIETLFYGTDYHSHLGTEFGGLAVMNGDRFFRQIHEIGQSQFKSKFFEDIPELAGNKGIGVISDSNEQPIYLNSKFGPFCIATMGLIENAESLVRELLDQGHSFSEMSAKGPVNTTELIARLIALGDNLIDGIDRMFDKIEGSCSLLILNKDGVYAARDRWGYTPLVVAKHAETYAIASETSSFPNSDLKIMKYLAPGEIVLLTEDGLVSQKEGNGAMQVCTFLWIYMGFPASDYEGISTEAVRERCGAALARRDKDIKADVVAGVPDSGTSHAIGYAIESGKPFRRPLVKYTPGYGRSYTPPNQEQRDLIARMKLVPIREVINGNRIVLCDDSIVRGTQLKNFTINKLWDSGAKEIHVRPACPPIMFPCKFCLSTRSTHELVARRAIRNIEGCDVEDVSEYVNSDSSRYKKMVDWITRDLGVTTLRYQTVEDMVKAIGLPREKLCLYCWTGECPNKCQGSKSKCENNSL